MKIFLYCCSCEFWTAAENDFKQFNESLAKRQTEKEQIEKALEGARIDPKRRGETLTIAEFAILSERLYDFFHRRLKASFLHVRSFRCICYKQNKRKGGRV